MKRVAIGLVIVALAAIGMSVKTQVDQAEDQRRRDAYEACTDRTVDTLVQVLTDTREVAATERRTTRQLYADIARRPDSFTTRIGSYLDELDAADKARAARPLPDPPSVACAGVR